MVFQKSDKDQIDVLVLAGGINRIPLYPGYNPGYKALLNFGNKPSILYVLDALERLPQLRRRVVVGPPQLGDILPAGDGWILLPGGKTVMESLFTGLGHLRPSEAVLCTTGDLPLLNPTSVTDFLKACTRSGKTRAGIFLSMVPEHAFTGPFSRVEKGLNRFRDIAVCHGNLSLLRPELLFNSPLHSRLNRLYRARKSTIRAALVLGPKVGLAYLVGVHLLRRLSLEKMAAIVSQNLGVKVVPILLEKPETTLDVDEPEDYQLVRKLLNC